MNLTVESSRTFSPMTLSISRPKGIVIAFWARAVETAHARTTATATSQRDACLMTSLPGFIR